jgi:hypothetical protein
MLQLYVVNYRYMDVGIVCAFQSVMHPILQLNTEDDVVAAHLS